jgi:hypothetical protein
VNFTEFVFNGRKQGPYRLNGKNGENFIHDFFGSEQVFIDGI